MPNLTGVQLVDWIAMLLFIGGTVWQLTKPIRQALDRVEALQREAVDTASKLRLHEDLSEYQADQLRQQGINVPYVIPPQLRRANL